MAAQTWTFHCFPNLPKELRDEIWRLCLPHRIVEMSRPCPEWHYEYGYPTWMGEPPEAACPLTTTSSLNRLPPIISRVCHEARTVAFQTGFFFDQEQPSELLGRQEDTRRAWVDSERDVLHQYWHDFLHVAENDPQSDYIFARIRPPRPELRMESICAELLDGIEKWRRRAVMQALSGQRHWLVCGAVVVIHTDKVAAIKSGHWGSLGEERVVLVKASDAERMNNFRQFWREHGVQEDQAAKVFFEAMADGVPKIHYMETPDEFLLDLKIRWLHDSFLSEATDFEVDQLQKEVWLTKPEDFDGRDDDPRTMDYGDLPGRPFARQLWSPNRDHPWVKDVLARMPEFTPTIMFRLCTDFCCSEGDGGLTKDLGL